MINNKTLLFCATSVLYSLIFKDNKKPNQNQLKLPSFRNILEVKSAIKGRIRFYVPLIKGNTMLSKQILEQLKGIPVIKNVEVNTITASLLITYDCDQIEPNIIEGAVIKLLGLDTCINKEEVSFIERELKTFVKAANKAILEKTSNFIDAKYVLVVWLIAISILKFIKGPTASLNPFNLLWWSSNIALKGRLS